jgi:hypothetical protein
MRDAKEEMRHCQRARDDAAIFFLDALRDALIALGVRE